jgi:hypothetical protein
VAAVLLWRADSPATSPVASLDRDEIRLVEVPEPAGSSPTLEQSQRLAGYLVAHSQYSSPIGRRNVLMNVLAEDPGIERVAFETIEAP